MGDILNYTMSGLHTTKHYAEDHVGSEFRACPTCPSGMQSGADVNYTIISNLLTGQDKIFRIAQGYLAPATLVQENTVLTLEPYRQCLRS